MAVNEIEGKCLPYCPRSRLSTPFPSTELFSIIFIKSAPSFIENPQTLFSCPGSKRCASQPCHPSYGFVHHKRAGPCWRTSTGSSTPSTVAHQPLNTGSARTGRAEIASVPACPPTVWSATYPPTTTTTSCLTGL